MSIYMYIYYVCVHVDLLIYLSEKIHGLVHLFNRSMTHFLPEMGRLFRFLFLLSVVSIQTNWILQSRLVVISY